MRVNVRSGAGATLISVGIVACAQFSPTEMHAPPPRSEHLSIALAASLADFGSDPLAALGSLPDADQIAAALPAVPGAVDPLLDITDPVHAGAGADFDPASLLLVPVMAFAFVLAVVPLTFTVAGSLFAVLVNQLGSGSGFGDIAAGAPEAAAPDSDALGATLLGGLDPSSLPDSIGAVSNSLATAFDSGTDALLTAALPDLGLAF